MRIEAIISGKSHVGHARFERGLVICAGAPYPGVIVSGINDWVDEVTSYALNEGCVLFDTIRSDEHPVFDIPWRVVYATSVELEETRLIRAIPTPEAVITTESRRIIRVGFDGVMNERGTLVASMMDIGEPFVLEIPGPELTLTLTLPQSPAKKSGPSM